MIVERTYTCRIFPTKEQQEEMIKIIRACQKVWNLCVKKYENSEQIYTKDELKQELINNKEFNSLSTLIPLLCVRSNFELSIRKHKAHPQQFAMPKYKKEIRGIGSFTIFTKYKPQNEKLYIYPFGLISIADKGAVLADAEIKSVLIKCSGSSQPIFTASITVSMKQEAPEHERDRDCSIGLDYSAKSFYVDSNGNSPERPPLYRETEEEIAAMQSKLSKMKKGGSRYNKLSKKLFKLQRKITNRRKDFLHKLSNELTDNYDYICVETLDLAKFKEDDKLKLGKSTCDNSWFEFLRMLDYKSKVKGKKLIKIDRYFPSSKTCSNCGHPLINLKINTREWTCPSCGITLDRDKNAAINILREGLKQAD